MAEEHNNEALLAAGLTWAKNLVLQMQENIISSVQLILILSYPEIDI